MVEKRHTSPPSSPSLSSCHMYLCHLYRRAVTVTVHIEEEEGKKNKKATHERMQSRLTAAASVATVDEYEIYDVA